MVYLKRRLREEKARAARAEQARREAEERSRDAEREKAMHRMLARRWHNRLNAVLAAQEQHRAPQAEIQPAIALDLVDDTIGGFLHGGGNVGGLAGLRALLQQHLDEDLHQAEEQDESEESEEEEEDEVEEMDHEMEEVEPDVEEPQQEDISLFDLLEDDHQSVDDVGDVPLAAGLPQPESIDDSVMMDVDSAKRRAYDQPRTVSISSGDL